MFAEVSYLKARDTEKTVDSHSKTLFYTTVLSFVDKSPFERQMKQQGLMKNSAVLHYGTLSIQCVWHLGHTRDLKDIFAFCYFEFDH